MDLRRNRLEIDKIHLVLGVNLDHTLALSRREYYQLAGVRPAKR
jgi:hypothetical protein